MNINEVNIRKRKSLYSEIYQQVLSDTMADYSPYEKANELLDAFFEKYNIPENLKCNTMSAILTTMCQSAVSSSQSISLELLLRSDEMELKAEELALRVQELEAQILKIQAEREKIQAEKDKLAAEIELLGVQKALAEAEKTLTSARVALVNAQKEAELAKKPLIEREILVYNDNLRVKEAEITKDLLSAYSVGGLEVPTGLHQAVMNKIDKISKES